MAKSTECLLRYFYSTRSLEECRQHEDLDRVAELEFEISGISRKDISAFFNSELLGSQCVESRSPSAGLSTLEGNLLPEGAAPRVPVRFKM
jgi:hypothetical protein